MLRTGQTGTVNTQDVALVGCRWSGHGPATDLYPDPDAGPLQEALWSLDGSTSFPGRKVTPWCWKSS